jgi:hypothetical protein
MLAVTRDPRSHPIAGGRPEARSFQRCRELIPGVNLRMQGECRRQRCLKGDLLSGDGVLEFEKLGVQEISSIAREAGEIFKRLAG